MRALATSRVSLTCAAVLTTAVLLAACGSSSNSSSQSSAAGTASNASSKLAVQPPTSPVTTQPITTPLKSAPPKGKSLVWLACNLPACQGDLSLGYKTAAAALGWKFTQINYAPTSPGPAVQQALNDNPSYIAITGIPPVAFAQQDAEAMKRHIPIVSCFDTTPPVPAKNGMYLQCANGPGYGDEANQITRWITNNSGGKAHVAIVNVPDYPILSSETASMQAGFKKYCPGCKVSVLNIAVGDLGNGSAPGKIVAYLQSHPDINYLHVTFADVADGLPQQLQAAGLLSHLKITGVQSDPPALKNITDGKIAAFTAQPQEYVGWEALDVLARLSEGMKPTPYEVSGDLPTWVVDSSTQAKGLLALSGQQWPGPAGYQTEFKKVWHVG